VWCSFWCSSLFGLGICWWNLWLFLEDFVFFRKSRNLLLYVYMSWYSMTVELPLSALEMIALFRSSFCLICLMVLDSLAG
jgi:hypothetical protein